MATKNNDDLDDQKREIAELLKTPLRKGDTWYLISTKWFKQWQKYVGYDSEDTGKAGEYHPGPIDNTDLYKVGSNAELKNHLINELDYVLLPQPALEQMVKCFSLVRGQVPIGRTVIERSMFVKHLTVEVYLIDLKCIHHLATDNVIIKYFSRATTISYITNDLCKMFHVSDQRDARLWNKYMTNTYELLSKPHNTVQDVGLYPGQFIILDVQNSDGKWHNPGSKRPYMKSGMVIEEVKSTSNDYCPPMSGSTVSPPDPQSSVQASFRQALECPVCMMWFGLPERLPKILGCGHTFCVPCLKRMHTEGNMTCPKCRSQWNVPTNGIKGMVTNHTTVSLLETICADCKEELKSEICSHCSQILCASCSNKHRDELLIQARCELAKLIQTVDNLKVRSEGTQATIDTLQDQYDAKRQEVRQKIQELLKQQAKELSDIDEMQRVETNKSQSLKKLIDESVTKWTSNIMDTKTDLENEDVKTTQKLMDIIKKTQMVDHEINQKLKL